MRLNRIYSGESRTIWCTGRGEWASRRSDGLPVKRDKDKLDLYLSHRSALVDYAAPIVGCRARAEDVVQEAFIRFAPADRQNFTQPVAYLYRIVRNLALDLTRRRGVELREEEEGRAWWMLPARPRTPEEETLHRRDLAALEDALAAMPAAMRTAVEMHRFGGFTLDEVAARLGVSPAGAHRLVREGLVRIAATLPKERT